MLVDRLGRKRQNILVGMVVVVVVERLGSSNLDMLEHTLYDIFLDMEVVVVVANLVVLVALEVQVVLVVQEDQLVRLVLVVLLLLRVLQVLVDLVVVVEVRVHSKFVGKLVCMQLHMLLGTLVVEVVVVVEHNSSVNI